MLEQLWPALGNPNPESDGDGLVRRSEIELLLAESRWDEALAAADKYHMRLRGIDNPAWAPWRSLKALAVDGLGRHGEAMRLLDEELDEARRWGAPGTLARTLRLAGMVRRDDGHELLREAVAVAERSPARLEHAKALIALGSALRRGRRRSDSREPSDAVLSSQIVAAQARWRSGRRRNSTPPAVAPAEMR